MNDCKIMREKVRSLSVLVVDDKNLILEVTSSFLRNFFDHVDTAKNGNIALEKFKKDDPYDIVLSDMKMPKMRGDQLIKEIKKIDSNVLTMIMSASPELTEELNICDMYLTKPVSIDGIIAFLDMIIEKRNL